MGYRKIGYIRQLWYMVKYAMHRHHRRKEGKNGKG